MKFGNYLINILRFSSAEIYVAILLPAGYTKGKIGGIL
jgi:hypothetical protein